MQERLQKIMSARGICSRRKAEEYIKQGLVRVNGEVAELGQKADSAVDEIEVDGKVLEEQKSNIYLLLRKPEGVVTTNASSADQKTVRDLLPKEYRDLVSPVGRLDKDSSGLLLLTNDGVLAYRLTHPKFYHEKEYLVEVDRPIGDSALEKMKSGMMILGQKTKPAAMKRLSSRKFTIALTEGKNRQIRRMCQKVDCRVKSLERIRIASLTDASLQPGQCRLLHANEVLDLKRSLDID